VFPPKPLGSTPKSGQENKADQHDAGAELAPIPPESDACLTVCGHNACFGGKESQRGSERDNFERPDDLDAIGRGKGCKVTWSDRRKSRIGLPGLACGSCDEVVARVVGQTLPSNALHLGNEPEALLRLPGRGAEQSRAQTEERANQPD